MVTWASHCLLCFLEKLRGKPGYMHPENSNPRRKKKPTPTQQLYYFLNLMPCKSISWFQSRRMPWRMKPPWNIDQLEVAFIPLDTYHHITQIHMHTQILNSHFQTITGLIRVHFWIGFSKVAHSVSHSWIMAVQPAHHGDTQHKSPAPPQLSLLSICYIREGWAACVADPD